MSTVKKIYACTSCGARQSKWVGKCPACNEWNTIHEEVVTKESPREERQKIVRGNRREDPKPTPLANIKSGDIQRLTTPDDELNRVLGGGIVPGALVLIGGQPGIGKSTLMLQIALGVKARVLYVSGEESEEQIKMRADRVGTPQSECFILTETNTNKILTHAQHLVPDMIVIDSIQTLAAAHIDATPGSISQVRECAGELQRFAKETNIPIFIIGHITKDGSIAGPKLLEHIVDTVLQFEGDQNYTYRILRTLKNRFGSTDEIGIYDMTSTGLQGVSNPSELLLSQTEEILSGSAICAMVEGMRPMLIETQALVSKAVYGTPQRSATGFDLRRLGMLLAVLEKRCGFAFGQNDVFLNIAGGIRVEDPAIDLAIISALISSLEDVCIPKDTCFAGEVGLSGEIRAVNRVEQRIQEAARLGFKEIFISKYNIKSFNTDKYAIRVRMIGKVEDLYYGLFK
jgi:DNA repair protein RadA/Sms